MEERQVRLLVWLAAALAALVAVIVLVEPPEDEFDEGWERAWEGLEADSIREIRVERAEDALALVRADGTWRLAEPIEAPADEDRANSMARTFAELEVSEDTIEGDAADFGLDEPRATVRVKTEGGDERVLVVGRDTPVGWRTYVRVGEDGAIRTSRSRLGSTLLRTVDEVRDRRVARVSAGSATRVEIGRPGGAPSLVLDKDDHGWWVEAEGARARADADDVRDLIEELDALRADRFPDPPPERPSGDGALEVRVRAGDEEVVLAIGPKGDDGRRVVAGPLQPAPVELASARLDELLARAPSDWLDAGLVPVRTATVEHVSVRLGDREPVEADRPDDGWEGSDVSDLLDAIGQVRVRRTLAGAGEPEGEPWGAIELREGERRTERVEIYQKVEGGRLAKDAAGGAAFVVPDTEIERLLDALPAE